jgi:hypothetical protein
MQAALAPDGAAAAAALLAAEGPPRVDAKELEGITLLRRRRGLARLDMGPFAVAYALVTAALLYNAINGRWWVHAARMRARARRRARAAAAPACSHRGWTPRQPGRARRRRCWPPSAAHCPRRRAAAAAGAHAAVAGAPNPARPAGARPPSRRAFTFLSYGLGAAAAAHVLAVLFTVWSVDWKALATCARVARLADAELVKVRRLGGSQSAGGGLLAALMPQAREARHGGCVRAHPPAMRHVGEAAAACSRCTRACRCPPLGGARQVLWQQGDRAGHGAHPGAAGAGPGSLIAAGRGLAPQASAAATSPRAPHPRLPSRSRPSFPPPPPTPPARRRGGGVGAADHRRQQGLGGRGGGVV